MSNSQAASDGRLAIGIDLGGTQVRAGLVQNGTVLRRAARRTDVGGGPAGVLTQFHALVEEVCPPADRSRLVALGISAPGPLDSLTGEIIHIPTLPGWDGIRLGEIASQQLALPVVVENDGIAAAYAEWQFGAGRGFDNIVFVTVSTGIGGGVVSDGRLLHGRRGMAGHVGHFRMASDGPRCACGADGCFEALASGTALGSRARSLAAAWPDSYLGSVSARERVEAHHVVDGARLGDEPCRRLLAEEADYLGVGFTAILHFFSPDVIVMGGGVSRAYDLMERQIHQTIHRLALPPFRSVRVVPAALGDNSGLIGAAILSTCSRPAGISGR